MMMPCGWIPYPAVLGKLIELFPAVARRFVDDMRQRSRHSAR
jgi:hypothetical protein